ncbi:MAG: hypothetical protein LBH72_04345 [Proteiniphilum sp.]|jgi:hypothetical protein|nr:hypothetical protein [Proteiniphilum sp.]
MNTHYIPDIAARFDVWQRVLVTDIRAKAAELGIPPDGLTRLLTLQERWNRAYSVAENPATRTKGAVKEKTDARREYVAELRRVIRMYITYNSTVSDQEREDMGLPVHSRKRTPAPPITSRPEMEVRFPQVQQHRLVVRDSVLKGRGLPPRAAGFEVWRRMGPPNPAVEDDWRLVTQASHSPFLLTYGEEKSGLRVYYRVRWVNTRGVPGPWSEIISAVIP